MNKTDGKLTNLQSALKKVKKKQGKVRSSWN